MSRTLALLATLALTACTTKPTSAADAAPGATDSGHTDDPGNTDDPGTTDDPAATARTYAERGALTVGHTVLTTLVDDTPLTVKAWYPSAAAADTALTYEVTLKLEGFGGAEVPFLGQAVRDGAPDTALGPRPLVVLSHGFSLNPEWYLGLAEHLASHGVVVLAPEHSESSWATDVVQSTLARPRDVSATLDLAESGVLEGIIDTNGAAVLGHSYGGYTALAAAGARIDLDSLEQRCTDVTDPFTASYFCDPFLAGGDDLAAGHGLSETPSGLWPGAGDTRVTAIVSMAGDAYLFGPEGLAAVTVPALVLGGTADTGTPWDWGSGLTADHVQSSDLTLAAFAGGEHMLPTTTCDTMPWTASLPEAYLGYFCGDPAWDKAEAQGWIHQLTTAFLLHTLTGEATAAAALEPALYSEVEGLALHRSQR